MMETIARRAGRVPHSSPLIVLELELVLDPSDEFLLVSHASTSLGAPDSWLLTPDS
jgi:hypothetical protein